MDEALDSTNTSELDKLIKDLIEANRPPTETKTPEKLKCEPQNSPQVEFSTPRYTEAVRQRMTRIALVPVKKTVHFSDDCEIDLRAKEAKCEVF